jgi:glycosyltransferase involved in cell wall biosynthesis
MKKAFPAKVYDFIGAGLPVLIAPGGELADMVNQSKIGVTFSEINPINIAAEIIRLKNDQVRMKSLRLSLVAVRSEFGRRLASRDFVSRLIGNQFSE